MQNTINKYVNVNRGNSYVHALNALQWALFDTLGYSSNGVDDGNSNNNKLRYVTHITVQKPQNKQMIE